MMNKNEEYISKFIRKLRKSGYDLNAGEIADILWIAHYTKDTKSKISLSDSELPDVSGKKRKDMDLELPHISGKKGKDADSEHPDISGKAGKVANSEFTGLSEKTEIPKKTKTQQADRKADNAPLHMPGRKEEIEPEQTVSAVPFRSPAATALPGKLALNRALRPLKRRIPSRTCFELDAEATARGIAETDIWIPKKRPALTRWLDLVILADQGSSMIVWQETVAELKKLLEQMGAFRNVRIWGFAAHGTDGEIRLYPFLYPIGKSGRKPAELSDPSGESLFLILSDCVSPVWHDGRIARMMCEWGCNARFAVLQFMPYRYWPRTGLGRWESVFFRASGPGTSNAFLKAEREIFFSDEDEDKSRSKEMQVPVSKLEPEFLTLWAKSLTGSGGIRIPGFLMPENPEPPIPGQKIKTDLTAQERVQLFHATASRTARMLAGYLTAIPLFLPVMRLVQRKMLPQSRQIHLAEVFLSGLMEKIPLLRGDKGVCKNIKSQSPDPSQEGNQTSERPESLQYRFKEGVAEKLRETVLVSETLEVVDAVSEYVEKNQGICKDFMAALPGLGDESQQMIQKGSIPFAKIKISLLRRLGGIYTKIAETLEPQPYKIKYPRRSQSLEVSEDEFTKVFRLDDNWRPLKYVPNEYKDNWDGTVTDFATGLMWEKSGSDDCLTDKQAEEYTRKLNRKKFAGHDNWRLPTIDELISLLEPNEKNGDLYIDPVFDKKQRWCWSADRRIMRNSASGGAWGVSFSNGFINWFNDVFNDVRAVRSG